MKLELLRVREVTSKGPYEGLKTFDVKITRGILWWRRTEEHSFIYRRNNYRDLWTDLSTGENIDTVSCLHEKLNGFYVLWQSERERQVMLESLAVETKTVWEAPRDEIDEPGSNTVRVGPHR